MVGFAGRKGDEREPCISPTSKETSIFQSMRLILKSFTFWQTGSLAFFRYGTFVSLQGLWLGPYLIDIEGYSPVQTGNVLIFLAIGSIVGSPIAGRLSDQVLRSRKGVALWGLALYTICLLLLGGILKLESPYIYVDHLLFHRILQQIWNNHLRSCKRTLSHLNFGHSHDMDKFLHHERCCHLHARPWKGCRILSKDQSCISR